MASRAAAISFVKLSKSIGSHVILKDISLSFDYGDRVLLVGANGAGKSTMLRLSSKLMRPSSGEVKYSYQPKDCDVPIGYMGHASMLYAELTVEENIRFTAQLMKLSAKDVETTLDAWELDAHRRKFPHQLSKGLLARVSLARAFIHKPRFLFLDEPTSALDQRSVDIVLAELEKLWAYHQGNMLVVLTTHDLARLKDWAQRVIVLDNGRVLVDSGTHQEHDRVIEESFAVYLQHNR